MAKTTVSKTKQPRIPAALERHLQDQQRATYTIEALLNCMVHTAVEKEQDDIEWAARHIVSLVKDLAESLDSVTIKQACNPQAVAS